MRDAWRWIVLVGLVVCPEAAPGQVRRPGEWTHSDSASITTYQEQLQITLQNLKNAQHSYRRAHHTYAPSVEYFTDPPTGHPVYILEATGSGWSAVVFHERAPGIRCYIHEGNARSPSGRVEPGKDRGCYGTAVALLPLKPDSLLSPANEMVMAQPPQQRDCHEAENRVRDGRLSRTDLFQRHSGFEGKAKLRFVVGTDGEIEPGNFTVLETSNSLAALDAMVLVVNCGYEPGIVNGRVVRVLVQQQINFAN